MRGNKRAWVSSDRTGKWEFLNQTILTSEQRVGEPHKKMDRFKTHAVIIPATALLTFCAMTQMYQTTTRVRAIPSTARTTMCMELTVSLEMTTTCPAGVGKEQAIRYIPKFVMSESDHSRPSRKHTDPKPCPHPPA